MTRKSPDINLPEPGARRWLSSDPGLYDFKGNLLGVYALINKSNWRRLLLNSEDVRRSIILNILTPSYTSRLAVIQGKVDTVALQTARRFSGTSVYLLSDDIYGLLIIDKVQKIEDLTNLTLLKWEQVHLTLDEEKVDAIYVKDDTKSIDILDLARKIIKPEGRVIVSVPDSGNSPSISIMKDRIARSGFLVDRVYRAFPSTTSPRILTDESSYKEGAKLSERYGFYGVLKSLKKIKRRQDLSTYFFCLKIDDRRNN
jgi:hypothetical protein